MHYCATCGRTFRPWRGLNEHYTKLPEIQPTPARPDPERCGTDQELRQRGMRRQGDLWDIPGAPDGPE